MSNDWWVSLCDEESGKFVGACIVESESEDGAREKASVIMCYPGAMEHFAFMYPVGGAAIEEDLGRYGRNRKIAKEEILAKGGGCVHGSSENV